MLRYVALFLFVLLLQIRFDPSNQQALVKTLNATVVDETTTCSYDALLDDVTSQIRSILSNVSLDSLGVGRPGHCGGLNWTRIAYLNMTDLNQTCPSNWTLVTYPGNSGTTLRACQRKNAGSCDVAYYSVKGKRYTQICGRIVANAYGQTEAFNSYLTGVTSINSYYLDGMDITRGNPRQHVWSFASSTTRMNTLNYLCPCSNKNLNINSSSVPPFVGSNYFCDCGAPPYQSDAPGVHYYNHIMWSGTDCPPYSTCCSFSTPPWFWRVLPNSTTDDIEVRQCANNVLMDENIDAIIVEVYIK
eukprot:Em0007g751a